MDFDESFFSLIAGSFHRLPEEIQEATRFKKDLKADCLGFLEMILSVECFYRCALNDDDLRTVETVGDLKDILKEKVPSGVERPS